MDDALQTWTIEHFSQENPKGSGVDVPALLRRVADTIEELGDVEVQDITLHTRLNEDTEWWPSLTVYLHREAAGATEPEGVPPRRGLRSVVTGS